MSELEIASIEAAKKILEKAEETGKNPYEILAMFASLLKSEFEHPKGGKST